MVINGELHGFFRGKQGLRQGDPISSLLFVLAMDVLSKKLDEGVMNQAFRIHSSCEAPLITHLSFADDVLIFFDGTQESLLGILAILEDFKAVSGLSISRTKSEVMIDGGCSVRCKALAEAAGITQGALPVRYLGVPLTSKKMTKSDYQPLLDKITMRFNSWTSRHLSFAGRFLLIKSVIYSTISFWLPSLFCRSSVFPSLNNSAMLSCGVEIPLLLEGQRSLGTQCVHQKNQEA